MQVPGIEPGIEPLYPLSQSITDTNSSACVAMSEHDIIDNQDLWD